MKKALALLGAAALAVGGAAATTARADGGDNTVVTVNTRDDSTAYRFSFKIERVHKDTVTQTNAAVAAASCDSCETVAIALQVLWLTADPYPHDVEPLNLALAINVECTDCETLASAYQWVFTTGGTQPHLTPEGNQRIAEVRREAQELRRQDLSIWEIQARVAQLAAEVQDVLATEVVYV